MKKLIVNSSGEIFVNGDLLTMFAELTPNHRQFADEMFDLNKLVGKKFDVCGEMLGDDKKVFLSANFWVADPVSDEAFKTLKELQTYATKYNTEFLIDDVPCNDILNALDNYADVDDSVVATIIWEITDLPKFYLKEYVSELKIIFGNKVFLKSSMGGLDHIR